MKFIINEDIYENHDFIVENNFPIPIYVEKSDEDINIKVKTYKQRYTYFGAFNSYLIKTYISLFPKYSNNKYNLSQIFPLTSSVLTIF